jgi:hypothetical protein
MDNLKTNLQKSPNPRPGLLGIWDFIVGPEMPLSETLLCLIPTLIATVSVPAYAVFKHLDWNPIQLIIAAIISFDIVGGAIANLTPTTKRWHHKQENGFNYHFLFIAIHLHPLLVTFLYSIGDWKYFLLTYSYLLFSTFLILLSPINIQRTISIILYLGAIIINTYFLPAISGMEWFVPVYFLKLLVSYLPKEANNPSS